MPHHAEVSAEFKNSSINNKVNVFYTNRFVDMCYYKQFILVKLGQRQKSSFDYAQSLSSNYTSRTTSVVYYLKTNSLAHMLIKRAKEGELYKTTYQT